MASDHGQTILLKRFGQVVKGSVHAFCMSLRPAKRVQKKSLKV